MQNGLRVQMVLSTVNNDPFNHDINLGTLCTRCGISRRHMGRLFTASIGITFRQYLRSVRMAKALKLLAQNNVSVKEVAFTVGYSTCSAFSRDFKLAYNLTPTEFRLRYRFSLSEIPERSRAQMGMPETTQSHIPHEDPNEP
jgi:AraC family transcriptional regulator